MACHSYFAYRPALSCRFGTSAKVILKGAASACYYPQPTYRQMGDIDFLVLPEHFERARLLMLGQNYQIQHYGMRRWPALKKYPRLKPLLTPFAWFWQLCRYLHLGLKREQPLKGLMQDVKKTRTKDALMEELGVKQRKKGTATRDGVMY